MPARQPASPAYLGQPLDNVPPLPLGDDDEQLVTLLQLGLRARSKGTVATDDERDDAVTRQPQLADRHPGQSRSLGNVSLQEVGSDLVKGRNLDRHVLGHLRIDDAEELRRARQGRALDTGEDDDEHQDDVEELVGALHVGRHRDRRQNDRHSPAQTGPGQEEPLVAAEPEPCRTGEDCQGARDKGQQQAGSNTGANGDPGETVGVGQQTEHDEQADLTDPADALREGSGGVLIGQVAIANHDGGDVNRGESGHADPHTDTVGGHGPRHRSDGVEVSGWQVDASPDPDGHPPNAQTDADTTDEFKGNGPKKREYADRRLPSCDPGQCDDDEDSRGVVEARLSLEHGSEPIGQGDPPKHGEHGSRVSRGGGRAEKGCNAPVQAERVVTQQSHDAEGDANPGGRQQGSWTQGRSDVFPVGR